MAVSAQRDPEQTAKQLAEWLGTKIVGGSDIEVSRVNVPKPGFSNETLSFDASWMEDGYKHEESLVARVQPGGHQLFLDADVFLQYRMMEAVGAASDVAVPSMFWTETDSAVLGRPFFVMGHVEGRVPTVLPSYHSAGWVRDLSPAQRERQWLNALEALVKIGQIDVTSGFDFLHPPDEEPGLSSYLNWVRRWHEWVSGLKPPSIIDAGLEYVLERQPKDTPVAVVWGDAVSTNMIFAKDQSVAAVIDWEMAVLAPPEVDLGWWLFFERFLTEGMGTARLEGIPDRDETIRQYESLLGRSVADIEYYEVLGALRMAITVARSIDLQIEEGVTSPDTTMGTNNPVTQILADGLGLPIPELAPEYAAMVARVQGG